MIIIQLIETGEIKEVTRNIAHGLIDSGKAQIYRGYKVKPLMPTPVIEDKASLRNRGGKGKRTGYSIKTG